MSTNDYLTRSMSRRSFVGAAGGSALALLLAACGGNASTTSAAQATDSTATDSTAATSAVAAAGSYTLVEEGKLIVASDLDFPPLDSFEGGVAQGFDVDLSTEIAKKLGLTVEYLPPQDFDSIIPMIKQGGKADIGNSAFSITPERMAEIDFTDAYLDSNLGVAVKKDSEAKTEEALNNESMTIAVQAGTTGEAWARENLSKAKIVPLASVTVCMTGVSTGQYDAFCADLPVIGHQCTVSFTDCEIAIEIPTGEQYGIVVSKDNPGLTAAINAALAEIEADGTMAGLKEKWFGTTA